ncbi:stalk domain-containing protein [Metasolibacillus meyeri]|uniref:Stalk domain-containing protein n=1 Tax=Metasolibacillus meyeri TaxID=1071052 RepID=A0AAW9NYI5_9BACL|nr:stalk domain-containing protein [Metasolibacillus meyeri]MEC1180581.1 stalk domain-containing protein [Metasolibacillus meyeri]
MKKAMTMALTATLATSAITAPLAFAQDKIEPISDEVTEEVATNFIKLTGKLGEIDKRDSGILFTTIEQGDEIFSLTIDENTLVLDNTGKKAELKEGLAFTAFVNKNKPMLAIYPPQYTPEVVVVETSDMGIVEVGTFDKDFVNKENTLKLNLSEESQITNLAGEQVKKEDIIGKEVIVFYGPATFSIPAQTSPYNVVVLETEEEATQPEEIVGDFIEFTGEIGDIVTRENGTQLVVNGDKENPFNLAIDKETVVLDNTGKEVKLTKGMKFTAYVDSTKPVILIYPPQYAPEAIIVETEEAGFVDVSTYDENLVNKENTLKLNISEDTVITDRAGEKLTKEAIVEQTALVFYTASTRSIPAQTTPSKVIVLTNNEEAPTPAPVIEVLDVIAEIIEQDHYESNGVKMVPLRVLAESLGFTVTSTGKGAILTKDNLSYEITRNQKEYAHNRAIKTFEVAPALLEENKTYVPQAFIYSLRGE